MLTPDKSTVFHGSIPLKKNTMIAAEFPNFRTILAA